MVADLAIGTDKSAMLAGDRRRSSAESPKTERFQLATSENVYEPEQCEAGLLSKIIAREQISRSLTLLSQEFRESAYSNTKFK